MPKCVAFSPDGRRVLAGGGPATEGTRARGWIRVWDPATGVLLLTLDSAPGIPVEALTFSADGKRLFSGGYSFHAGSGGKGEVLLWDGRDLSPETEARRRDEALRRAAVACLADKRWPDAVSLFDELIDGGGLDWLPRERRGWAFLRSRQWQRAADDFGAATRLQPEQAPFWARWGWANAMLGRYEVALSFYAKAVELDPAEAWIWFDRGDVLSRYGHYDRAAASFARAIELAPEWTSWWQRYALVLLAQGKTAEYQAACAQMLKACSVAMWTRENRSIAAWTCALGPSAVADMKAVVAFARKNVPAEGGDADALARLGEVLYRAGEFDTSLTRLNEAVAKDGSGGSVEVRLFLAMTHQRLGHAKEAREWLGRVPEEPDATTAPLAGAASLSALLASPAPLAAASAWPTWASDPSQPIQPRLERQILRREAAALILGGTRGRGE
jgi:tetratricopeptide (TPR) repeat protein